MPIKEVLSVIAGLIMLGGFVPYAKDIVAGRVKPSRSTRLMMVLLFSLSILQQHSLGSGLVLLMSLGDGLGAIAILLLSFKHGVGGTQPIDFVCYALLAIDAVFWFSTGNTLAALHLSILGDIIGMTPVLIKTWRQPWTETPLFFATGVIGPLLAIASAPHYTYAILVFPAYIAVINLVEMALIYVRQHQIPHPEKSLAIDRQPLA